MLVFSREMRHKSLIFNEILRGLCSKYFLSNDFTYRFVFNKKPSNSAINADWRVFY